MKRSKNAIIAESIRKEGGSLSSDKEKKKKGQCIRAWEIRKPEPVPDLHRVKRLKVVITPTTRKKKGSSRAVLGVFLM